MGGVREVGSGKRGAVRLGEEGYGVWGESGGTAETGQGQDMAASLPA